MGNMVRVRIQSDSFLRGKQRSERLGVRRACRGQVHVGCKKSVIISEEQYGFMKENPRLMLFLR